MSLLLGTSGIIDVITGLIGGILYPLFSVFFLIIDGIQHVFFVFAGIDSASFGAGGLGTGNVTPITNGNSGQTNDTGLLYFLMNHDIVKNLLISIMILAIFLMIIFTVMAFIKNAYAAKPKGWKDIIGNAIKGLANFIFLPVCCLLGVWLGNILLQAINGATSATESPSMGRKLYIACAYNANSFRNEDVNAPGNEKLVERLDNMRNGLYKNITYIGTDKKFDWSIFDKCTTNGDYANAVDEMYSTTNISIYEWVSVEQMYSLFEINYLVLIVGGIFMLYVLGSLAFAMVRRMFILLTLFVISPGVCALYPLDEGKAVGSWAGEVKKQVLSAYGAVAGVNIFFSLIPLVDNIHIQTFAFPVLDSIVQIFILVVGLLCVKELIGLVSGFVGGEDAYGKGSSLMKSAAKEVGGRAGKAVAGTVGAFSRAHAAKKDGQSWWGSMGGSIGRGFAGLGMNVAKTATGGAIDIDAAIKAKKAGEEKYKEDKFKKQAKQFKKDFEDADEYKFFDDAENAKNATPESIAKFIKAASRYGIDDQTAYDMLSKKTGGRKVYDLKKDVEQYNKEKEDEKLKRAAAYNARGKEFETEIATDMQNVKDTDAKRKKADSDLAAQSGTEKLYKLLESLISKAEGRTTNKKGDVIQDRVIAVDKMKKMLTGEKDDTLTADSFKGPFSDAIAEFTTAIRGSEEALKAYSSAQADAKKAQQEYDDSVAHLKSTVDSIGEEFSDVKTALTSYNTANNDTVENLIQLGKDVQQTMRGLKNKDYNYVSDNKDTK